MPHCVFLPSTMNDQRLWSLLWPLLPADFDCVHVPLEQAQSRQHMQDMIAAACRTDSHLVGFSMGAYLALEFAHHQPRQWRSLSLLAVNSQGLAPAEAELRQRMLAWLAQHRYTGMSRQRLLQLLHPQHQADQLILALIRAMDQELGHEVLQVQLSQTQQRPDLSTTLTNYAERVLVVQGNADGMIPAHARLAMQARVATANWHTLSPAAHVLPLEQPETLAYVLTNFIRQHESALKMA